MSKGVSGVMRPSWSAPATVMALNVDPGSYVNETAWSLMALSTVAALAAASRLLSVTRVRVVVVDARPVGARQDRPGFGVHDDRSRALGRVLGADAGEHLLPLVLQRRRQRQPQRLARLHRAHVVDGDRLAPGVVDN